MPTAEDAQVFIKWIYMSWERNATSDGYTVFVPVEVSVAGERVATFTTFTLDDGTAFTTQLSDALDTKREQFVVA